MSKKLTSVHSEERQFRPSATRFAVAFLLVTLLGVALAQPIPQDSAAARSTTPPAGVLFQISTLDALSQGIYDASFSVAQAKQHGDFGLGTYEGLDGELIALDGHYYHMRSNGVLTEAEDSEKIPFAAITRFRPDVQFSVRQASLSELAALIDAVLPSKNFFYAVRIHGPFVSMSTRAIPQQFLPYPPLAQLIPTQTVFTYSNVVGTAVDIRCPAYFSGINQVGHHFHFVSDDKKAGGHALSFTTGDVTVDIQVLRQYALWLPNDEPFQRVTLPIQYLRLRVDSRKEVWRAYPATAEHADQGCHDIFDFIANLALEPLAFPDRVAKRDFDHFGGRHWKPIIAEVHDKIEAVQIQSENGLWFPCLNLNVLLFHDPLHSTRNSMCREHSGTHYVQDVASVRVGKSLGHLTAARISQANEQDPAVSKR